MKTALILGSNSFTGSHLVQKFLEKEYKVIGISRSKQYSNIMLPYLYSDKKHSNFKFLQLDANNNLKEILEICDSYEPSIIANFAAQGEVRNSWKFPSQWYQTNTISVVKLTDELRKRDYIQKYLAASTPEVYGSTQNNISESFNYNPSTPYAASKLGGDLHLMTLFKNYNFPVAFTRSANVYGVHQQLYRIIPRSIIYLKLNKKIQLHGNGQSQRSFINIKDVSDATFKVISKGKNGEIYHISKNEFVTIYSLVQKICEIMGFNFEESTELVSENFGQDSKYSISSKKIKKELNWSPKVSLETGLVETIKWINDNWKIIQKMPLEYVHKK